jgi:hypothetical protein
MPRLTDGLDFSVGSVKKRNIGQGTETSIDDSIPIPGEVGDYVVAGEPITGMDFSSDEEDADKLDSQEPNFDASSDSFYRSHTFQHAMEEVGQGLANFISGSTFLLSLSDLANWGMASGLKEVLPTPAQWALGAKVREGSNNFEDAVTQRREDHVRGPEWYIEQNLPLPSYLQEPAGTIWRGTSHSEGDDNGFEASRVDIPLPAPRVTGRITEHPSGQSVGRSARSGPSQEGLSESGRRRKETTYASQAIWCDPGLPREQQPWWCR